MGPSRGLQDLRKVAIAEGGKLIQHHAEERPQGTLPLLFAFISLPHHQLQVLKQHLAQSPDRLGVLVGLERWNNTGNQANSIREGDAMTTLNPADFPRFSMARFKAYLWQ